LIIILVGKQGDILHKYIQSAVFNIFTFAEFLDTVQQLLNVFVTAEAFDRFVFVKVFQQAAMLSNVHGCVEGDPVIGGGLEALDEQTERSHRRGCATVKVLRRVFDDFKQTDIVLIGGDHDTLNGGVSDAAARIINHPLQGFLVARIICETEVGNEILDFLTLIEGSSPENFIGNSDFSERFFHGTRLCIGAV